jgi:hypothetical protein
MAPRFQGKTGAHNLQLPIVGGTMIRINSDVIQGVSRVEDAASFGCARHASRRRDIGLSDRTPTASPRGAGMF